MKNDTKIKALLYGVDECVKCGVIETNIECLCCYEFEALEYFELLGMRCGDTNVVTQNTL